MSRLGGLEDGRRAMKRGAEGHLGVTLAVV